MTDEIQNSLMLQLVSLLSDELPMAGTLYALGGHAGNAAALGNPDPQLHKMLLELEQALTTVADFLVDPQFGVEPK